jgi:hypothetical protein
MRVSFGKSAKWTLAGVLAVGVAASPAIASTPRGDDVRLTNDAPGSGGYVSNYNMNHPGAGVAKDPVLAECSRSRGRQNEPSVGVDPRDPLVIVGSSNDYCGVYDDGEDAEGAPIPSGPIWLGYYRSENGGTSFTSSLVPGYPGDNTPYADRAHLRTASSGDPVEAWDGDGRLFMGSESSDDPAGTPKGFGDVWVATYENPAGTHGATADDGQEFIRSVMVAKGSSAPNYNGVFNDKTAIAADRTSNPATRGNVYFSNSRFVGSGGSNIYFYRSTDHGRTFSHGTLLTKSENDVQNPDIAINGDGTVTMTWNSTLHTHGKNAVDAVRYAISRDGGRTFTPAATAHTYTAYTAQDTYLDGSRARDCGDLVSACVSGYHFFRRDSSARSSADQTNPRDHRVWIVLDPVVRTVPSEKPTFSAVRPGVAGRSAVEIMTLNSRTGAKSGFARVDRQPKGQQLFPDVSADSGVVHLLWWDSRHDACYSPARPIGNCADGSVAPSLDAYGTALTSLRSIPAGVRLSEVTTDPNWEQFTGRTDPFAGDYLWVDSAAGTTYSTWTDWRDTVAGDDPRTPGTSVAEVKQCRHVTADGSYSGDTCPRAGGLDQNIYGDLSP